jgi:hypothetical protein
LAYLHADIIPAQPRTQQLKVLANILAPQLCTVRQISAVPKIVLFRNGNGLRRRVGTLS